MKRLIVVALAACSSPEIAAPDLAPPSVEPIAAFAATQQHAAAPVATAPAPVPPAEPPPTPAWSLTASDGSGLRVVEVEAKVVVEGPLAFTELHLAFENPEDRVREGTFAITLPAHAAVSRFAMEDRGHIIEAEVVPKALARRAYDDALHRGVDPAILEKAAGNAFSARVFPIPARGVKHLVVSYSQELPGEGYRLPLRGLPKVDRVAVDLDTAQPDGSRRTQSLRHDSWQPDQDFVASVASTAAVGAGEDAVGAFEVSPADATTADRPDTITLLVDTSGSRAAGFVGYLDRVRTLVHDIGVRYGDLPVEVVAFDQEAVPIYTGPASGFGDREVATLLERDAAGASDLSHAVASLARAPKRLVVITDGVVTAGHAGSELGVELGKLGVDRVDVVLAGGIRDDHAARELSHAGTRAGDVFDLDGGTLAPIARGLGEAVRVDVDIEVADATWYYPHAVRSLRAHTPVVVFARFATPRTMLEVTIGGTTQRVTLARGTPALVGRATAGAEIDELEARLAATSDKDGLALSTLKATISDRSVAARVVSSQTAMLVLEHDQDYARYGIDRRALGDVLVVGAHGLEQQHRTFVAIPEAPPAWGTEHDSNLIRAGAYEAGRGPDIPGPHISRQQAIEQAREAGVLGSTALAEGALGKSGEISSGFDSTDVFGSGTYSTIGTGHGTGGGYGAGGGGTGSMRGRTAEAPTVAVGHPTVSGSLDTSIIRRYVRRHTNQITYCYERELLARPTLEGSITTRFVIGVDGKVTDATASGFDATVASCVAGVLGSIEFPPGADSVAQVNYPFVFRRTGSDAGSGVGAAALPAPAPDATTSSSVGSAPPPPPPPEEPHDGLPPFGPPIDALDGDLARVTRAIAHGAVWDALAIARRAHAERPTDVLAWVGLGEALEANGQVVEAARAYGSIIDLYSTHADLRRFAAERLEHLGERGRAIAIDSLRRAVADRPDQITGHRLLAYALVRARDFEGAWKAIQAGADQMPRSDSYLGSPRVFADDLRMIGSAYAAHGGPRADIEAELKKRNLDFATAPSTRFILYWETDANDVDLHVKDAHGHHAFFGHMQLETGGALYADITTGFGPECFAIDGTPSAGPYELGVHYYRQGPMGYGMGMLQVEQFDGTDFVLDDRPYVIMKDQAYVGLGRWH